MSEREEGGGKGEALLETHNSNFFSLFQWHELSSSQLEIARTQKRVRGDLTDYRSIGSNFHLTTRTIINPSEQSEKCSKECNLVESVREIRWGLAG